MYQLLTSLSRSGSAGAAITDLRDGLRDRGNVLQVSQLHAGNSGIPRHLVRARLGGWAAPWRFLARRRSEQWENLKGGLLHVGN